ncbi:MAG: glucokinase [Candidatus Rokuibacteriota bacterium]
MIVLAGDVGGTKTNLALYDKRGSGLIPVRETSLQSRQFDSLEAAIQRFLEGGPRQAIDAACLGVAGPVVEGRCVATNLPWIIDEQILSRAIPAAKVRLMNDLEAAGYGVLVLPANELRSLQAGVPKRGSMAVIAAGTGLGEAMIVREGERRVVIATEGGHTDFAPRGDLEEDLLKYLRKEFGRVSVERILAGPGFFNLYRFLRDTGWAKESPEVADKVRSGDPAAVITSRAGSDGDPLCVKVVEMFVSIYGAEAGNLALKTLAVGGVVVAGGIAPRIIDWMTTGNFMTAFKDKGRLSPLMDGIPVQVALNPKAPLLGAAEVASTLI